MSLKNYKKEKNGRNIVIESFPRTLMTLLCSSHIINIYGEPHPIGYDGIKSFEFITRMSDAIAHDNFDLLDDIIIDFVKTYHYTILTPEYKMIMFPVNFPEDAEKIFREICNSFKGKQWNDVLSEFIDALYTFTDTATIHGDTLIK